MNQYMQELIIEVICVIAVIIFIAITNFMDLSEIFRIDWSYGTNTNNTGRRNEEQRRAALRNAQLYLSPYTDIWQNLQLSNKYCTLRLGFRGRSIVCTEKVMPHRQLRITASEVTDLEQAWNLFCRRFHHGIYYYDIVLLCDALRLRFRETISASSAPKTQNNTATSDEKNKPQPIQKLDINNCSEIELTELPGISIVLAKKIIKKREEAGGFKSLDEFFIFLNLKSHFVEQLQYKVKVGKMRGKLIRKYDTERTLDI